MILNLDELKTNGEIPKDLDAQISRIMGLEKLCFGSIENIEYKEETVIYCLQCGHHFYAVAPVPHKSAPRPYSSDLIANEELLGWLEKHDISWAFGWMDGHSITLIHFAKEFTAINFTELRDKPLALAIGVYRLFGSEK